MNTARIATLYTNPIFNTLLRFPKYDPTTSLSEQVSAYVVTEARRAEEDGQRYRAYASEPYSREKYYDEFGNRSVGFIHEYCTKRQADWMLSQVPYWPGHASAHLRPGMLPELDTFMVNICAESDEEAPIFCRRYGAREDLGSVLRGLESIRRKRQKQARKLAAQLRAYHQGQEQRKLREGHWLGAAKALTTAARLDEPGVGFLGDASLSSEQLQGLRYWAVPEREGRTMGPGFPAGTGLALKPVKRSREMVDGAVYVYHYQLTDDCPMLTLARLDLSRKQHGLLPLFHDQHPHNQLLCWAAWSDPKFKLYQVLYYTTRNGATATPPRLLLLPEPAVAAELALAA